VILTLFAVSAVSSRNIASMLHWTENALIAREPGQLCAIHVQWPKVHLEVEGVERAAGAGKERAIANALRCCDRLSASGAASDKRLP